MLVSRGDVERGETDRVSLGQVHTEFRRLEIGYENRDRGRVPKRKYWGDKKSWTVSLSHAVTSLAKEVGGERSEVSRAESGICIIREGFRLMIPESTKEPHEDNGLGLGTGMRLSDGVTV